jgi:clan AA aspartic protease
MGLTYISADIFLGNEELKSVPFLVDSGASYSLLPERIWKSLKLEPKRTVSAVLADGTRLDRNVGECGIRLNGVEGHTPVVLGQPGDEEALLGAITLENLGFVLDPFKRTLRPMQIRL